MIDPIPLLAIIVAYEVVKLMFELTVIAGILVLALGIMISIGATE
jgi:hypothetical protein